MIIRGNTVGSPLPDPRKGISMEGAIHMNGQALTGLKAPENDADAVNWGSVKNIGRVRQVEAVLTAAGWQESETAGFTQSLTVLLLTDEKKLRIYPNPPATLGEKLALAEQLPKVKACTREGEVLTFEAWEEKPETDIPVMVEVIT